VSAAVALIPAPVPATPTPVVVLRAGDLSAALAPHKAIVANPTLPHHALAHLVAVDTATVTLRTCDGRHDLTSTLAAEASGRVDVLCDAAELAEVVARMDAGLPTVDPTLPDRYSSTLAQLVDARTRIAELEKRVGETPRAGLLAELEKQKAARAGDLTKVKHTLRQMHEINARVTYALRGLASIGLLTPTAAQVLHTCSRAMPPGFFDTWATEHHGAFVEAALTHKARNGATLEEPAGERRDALDVVMEQQAEAS
jgi:hypothetical protein